MPLHASAYVPQTIEKRPVEFPDGVERDLFFRHLAHSEWEAFRLASQVSDPIEAGRATTLLIQLSLVEPDGTPGPAIPGKLEDAFAKRLVTIILEVNGKLGPAAKKLAAAAKKK